MPLKPASAQFLFKTHTMTWLGVVRRDAESVALARLKIVKDSCLGTLERGKEVVDGRVTTLEEELGDRTKKEEILLASL